MTKIDRAKINEVIRSYIKDSLEFDENFRIDREDVGTDDEIEKMVKAIDIVMDGERQDLAKGDYEMASQAVDDIIKNYGLNIAKGSTEYKMLSREVLKAKTTIWKIEKARTIGDYSSPEEEALKPLLDPTHWALQNQGSGNEPGPTNQQPQQTSATMKQAGDEFWNEFNQDWKPRSRTDYKNAIEQIVEGLGP